jgi:hypothetical protein
MTVDELPIEIRHLMMYRQKEQHGKKDWSVFKTNGKMGGFVFHETPEKWDFWNVVLNREEFDVFYAKYPKVDYPKDMPEEIIMLALDRRVEQGWITGSIRTFGFAWSRTPEQWHFWSNVSCGEYKVYYEKYHSESATITNNPCCEIPLSTTVSFSHGGQIADFPPEIVEMMLQRQFEQVGKRDASVFEGMRECGKSGGGFDWDESPEDHDFWETVIDDEKFDVFFEKYPKEFNSHIKTKQNEKGNTTINGPTTSSSTGIKVQRPVATITEGERRTASGVSGRRSSTAIASRRIGYKTVIGL